MLVSLAQLRQGTAHPSAAAALRTRSTAAPPNECGAPCFRHEGGARKRVQAISCDELRSEITEFPQDAAPKPDRTDAEMPTKRWTDSEILTCLVDRHKPVNYERVQQSDHRDDRVGNRVR